MTIEDSIKRLREALPKAPRGPYSSEYGNADSSAGGQWWAILDDDTGTDLLHFPYDSTAEREAEAEAVAMIFAACSPEVLAHLLSALDEREALRSALDRVTANYRLTLAGKPVRDVTETLAEADAALKEQP